MRKLLISIAVALTASVALTACGSDSGSSTADSGTAKIKIGYPSDTASYGDLYVCQDEGIFKKNGLEVELSLLKTSSQLLAALTSDSVQIAGGDGRAVAAGALKGADLRMIELKIPAYFVEMWGGKDIQSLDQLRGKKVGVTAPGSVTDAATRLMLKDKGLADDVEVANLNSLPALLAAAKSGAVDALVTAPPQGTSTQSMGWHKITDMTNYKTAASVYTVSGKYADEHPDVVASFVKADVECLSFLHKAENKEKSVDAIQKYTKTEDREGAAYAYDFFAKIWATDPVVDEDLIREAFVEAAVGGDVPDDLSKFIDNSYLDKLRDEGLIDEPKK